MNNLTIEEEYCIDTELLAEKYGSAARVLVVYPKDRRESSGSTEGSHITVVPFDELGGKVLRRYVSRKSKSHKTSLTTRTSGDHLLAVVIRTQANQN